MPKDRSGYVYQDKQGKWFARVTIKDEKTGKRRNIKRKGANKVDAKATLKTILRQLEIEGSQAIDNAEKTFNHLADHYAEHYLIPASYRDGRKICGLRETTRPKETVARLREYFGGRKLRAITYGDISAFRLARLQTPTRYKRPRTIASVNRELAVLRRMLNIAVREGWLLKNPFGAGEPLISQADERKRERTITKEEEGRLLAACVGRRAHVRPIVIAALDTGCRLGELLKLRWKDVDFNRRLITIRAMNTKTLRERQIALTTRFSGELTALATEKGSDPARRIFGMLDNVKRSWAAVRKAAGLYEAGNWDRIVFHSLRHTTATRLDDLGFSVAKIGGQLGHTQLQTTLRYVNRHQAGIAQIAEALDTFNHHQESKEPPPGESEAIN